MSRSNAPRRNPSAIAGFTLLEMMVSIAIAMVIFLAVLGAYYYLARNLTRLANTQSLEVANRRAIYLFTRDVSTAKQITASATQITLLVPVPPSYKTVVYIYAVTNGTGALTRTATPATAAEDVSDSSLPQAHILGNLTAFSFNFYGLDGTALTTLGSPIKAVEFTYSTSTGASANGTLSNYSAVSPRVILRNKPYLE
jgi:Tfp pilus assembly protein PilW